MPQQEIDHQEILRPTANALADVIEANAQAHPERWHSDQEPLFGREGYVALSYDKIGVERTDSEDNTASSVRPISSRSWMVSMYGGRWTESSDGTPTLQTTDVQNLPTLHEEMAQTVLVDEHTRTAKLVDESEQIFGKFTDDSLRLWLQTIHEGHTPIMGSGEISPDGSKQYITHDYTDFHTSSNMLWGRDVQDKITEVSGYELQRLENGGPVPDKEHGGDGIGVIDRVTCEEHQVGLVDYALHGPGQTPKERMLDAWEQYKNTDFDTAEAWNAYRSRDYLNPGHAAVDLHTVEQRIHELENNLQFARSNGERYATEQEKAAAMREAIIGLTRVAEKLEGTYDGTALELPTEEQPLPEYHEDESYVPPPNWEDATDTVTEQSHSPKPPHGRFRHLGALAQKFVKRN
jgi:hypothetical protein